MHIQNPTKPPTFRGNLDFHADFTTRADRHGLQKSELARQCTLERSQGRAEVVQSQLTKERR